MLEKNKVNKRDFVREGESKIQGTGVFAKKNIPKGTRIIEYKGEKVDKSNLHQDFLSGITSLIYVLNLNDEFAIDGERNGNLARFINHSCEPNCEVYIFDEIPYIYAMDIIPRWQELTFDYKLQSLSGKKLSKAERIKLLPCKCGSKKCRKTLIVQ